MKKCPFTAYGPIVCVYIDQEQHCEDVEICPGNSDSFCGSFIEVFFSALHKRHMLEEKQRTGGRVYEQDL